MTQKPADLASEVQRLLAAAETLAALCVHLRHATGAVTLPPDLAKRVARVAEVIGCDASTLDKTRATELAGLVQALLGQAAAFAADAKQPPIWNVTDPVVLQGQGRGSAVFAPLIRDMVLPQLADHEKFSSAPTILDVGAGVAALSVAFAETFPNSKVVGIDVWPPSLELARANVKAAKLEDRIEIRQADIVELEDVETYDLIFFSGPFVPGALHPHALKVCARGLKKGGFILYATFGGGDDLSNALADLRTHRSGGPVLTNDEIVAALRAAGLVDAKPIELTIGVPARVVAARRSL